MAGQKLRFDVFKRDAFTCQYCGRTPPQVVLEVDHINPVCEGGLDEIDNLLTACFDCNRGKGGETLTNVPESLAVKIARKKELAEQMAEYTQYLADCRHWRESAVERLGKYWFNCFLDVKDKYIFSVKQEASVKMFLKTLPEPELMESIDIAMARRPPNGRQDGNTFKYFCGVCWSKIRERASE